MIQRNRGVAVGDADTPFVVGKKLEMSLDPVPSGHTFGISAKGQRRGRHDMKAFADSRVRLFHRSLERLRDIVGMHMMKRLQAKVWEANRPFVREIVEHTRIEIPCGTNRRPAGAD